MKLKQVLFGVIFSVCLIAGTAAPAWAGDWDELGVREGQKIGDVLMLFNGKDLTGWEADVPGMDRRKDLNTPFFVRDGLLISAGRPLGHLVTKGSYRNYRLEVDYRFADKPGNCGVLVHCSKLRARSNLFPQSLEVQMMHGNAGDFWCISEDIRVPNMVKRRGPKAKWGSTGRKNRRIKNLTNHSENPVGNWNRMVIECVGKEVKVWVNGELVNHGFDCTADSGKIALQAEGSRVEFKRVALISITQISKTLPTASQRAVAECQRMLGGMKAVVKKRDKTGNARNKKYFNKLKVYIAEAKAKAKLKAGLVASRLTGKREMVGADLSNWEMDVPAIDRALKAGKKPRIPFVIRDGMLVSLGRPGGHLMSKDVFENYRMSMTYRFANKPGNCGFIVGGSQLRVLNKMFPSSIEVQLLHGYAGDFWCINENIKVPNMYKRRGKGTEPWSILMGRGRNIANLTDNSEKPVGQWNTMVVECLGGEIKVWVNGDLVNYGFDCSVVRGHIGIQAEGSEVEFKNITLWPITKLSKRMLSQR